MKHMKRILSYIFAATIVLGFSSCDKIFDSLEGDLSKMYADQLTATEAGIDRGHHVDEAVQPDRRPPG